MANDLLRYLVRMFDYAIRKRYRSDNPTTGFTLQDAGGTEHSRTRWLDCAQLSALATAMRTTENFGRINELSVWLLLALCVRKMKLPFVVGRWNRLAHMLGRSSPKRWASTVRRIRVVQVLHCGGASRPLPRRTRQRRPRPNEPADGAQVDAPLVNAPPSLSVAAAGLQRDAAMCRPRGKRARSRAAPWCQPDLKYSTKCYKIALLERSNVDLQHSLV